MFAALKSLVARTDPAFPFEIREPIRDASDFVGDIWQLHEGVNKNDKSRVTIFIHNKTASSAAQTEAAQNAVKRLKTLRHPQVLRFLASTENETTISMATEQVVPVLQHIQSEDNELGKSWGIFQILSAMAFLVDCSMSHNNISSMAVFVDTYGDWKLGGFEYLSQGDTDPPTSTPPLYHPPELLKGQANPTNVWARDMWGLGCLIWEVHNHRLTAPEQLKDVKKLPKTLVADYAVLLSTNARKRPRPSKLREQGRAAGKYFDNPFVDACLFLEEVAVKDKEEVALFYKRLPDVLDKFPPSLCKMKILPKLLHAFQFAGGGYQLLTAILKIGKMLSVEEYQAKIVPCIVKLFASPDRATRINLLKQLDVFVSYLSSEVVTNDIFPNICVGFSDSVPAMREQSVKSILLLAPKLSQTALDTTLMKAFAKLQTDEQPGIRTNTTICLGKIASYLSESTRQRVLGAAFLRGMKDPFPPARSASLMAVGATIEYYSPQECAARLLPATGQLCLDKDKAVREQALKVVRLLVAALERNMEKMSKEEAERPAELTKSADASSSSKPLEESPSSLLGWANTAVSGFSKFRGSQEQPAQSDEDGATVSAPQPTNTGDKSAANPIRKGSDPKPRGVSLKGQAKSSRAFELKTDTLGGVSDGWEDEDFEDANDRNLAFRDLTDTTEDHDGWGDSDVDLDLGTESNPSTAASKHIGQSSSTPTKGWDAWDDDVEPDTTNSARQTSSLSTARRPATGLAQTQVSAEERARKREDRKRLLEERRKARRTTGGLGKKISSKAD